MKFCLSCGHEVEDDVVICPYCGKKVSSKSYSEKKNIQSSDSSTNKAEFEISLNMEIFIRIFGAIFSFPGLVLLLFYGYKEYDFRSEYDLSELSEAEINIGRELTGNDLNITLIIVGAILLILGVFISNILKILKHSKK